MEKTSSVGASAGRKPVEVRLRDLPRWGSAEWATWLRDFSMLVAGIFLFSIALSLTLLSNLGANSWTVLHDGIAKQTPLTIGQATIVVGLFMLGVSWLVGIRPGLGTVMNMVLVGVFLDLILGSDVIPMAEAYPLRIAMLVVAVVVMGLSSAMYISAGMGAGPRDSFMLALSRITGWRIGFNRWMMEGGVVVVGALLGGRFGIGTIIFAILVGPSIDFGFRVFGLTPRSTSSRGWSGLRRRPGATGDK